jgi:hypothetical protein
MADWMKDWHPGVWWTNTHEVSEMSFRIPDALISRYNRTNTMAMPAGPLVTSYRVQANVGGLTEYGYPSMDVYLDVDWHPKASEVESNRQKLFGTYQKSIDYYHSQAAISGSWLLLNELNRKIEKTRRSYHRLQDEIVECSPEWDDLNKGLYEFIRRHLKYDRIYAVKYAKDHETSTVIPGSLSYRGQKWTALSDAELRYVFDMSRDYLDDFVDNYDELRMRTHKPDSVGRGIRARSEVIDGIRSEYKLNYSRSRQVVFSPYLSTWFAFMAPEDKVRLFAIMAKEAEKILGVELLFPSILKGAYWPKILDYVNNGFKIINGDGSNWETWSAAILGNYIESVNDGIFQFMSGTSSTSRNGTLANLMLIEPRLRMCKGSVEAIGCLGDVMVLIGKGLSESDFHIDDIWEVDRLATDQQIILGIKMFIGRDGGYHGTFPGMYRITVDRGDKKRPIKEGVLSERIGNNMSTESFSVYTEIMSHGTIHDTPFLDYIRDYEAEDFWDEWARSRYEMLHRMKTEGDDEDVRGKESIYE